MTTDRQLASQSRRGKPYGSEPSDLGNWAPDDPEARARRRLVLAIEEVRAAARALGLDATSPHYAPWSLRAEAWLYRSGRLLQSSSPREDEVAE